MKIDSPTPSPATPPRTQPSRSNGPAATAPAKAGSTGNDVAGVRLVDQASGSAALEAPIDSQRVAELRQAIADGRLQIDANKIADRVLEGIRETLAKSRPAA